MQRTDTEFNGPRQAADALGLGLPLEWRALPGGRSNRLFWGAFPDGKLVFKFFDDARSNSFFPNTGHDEQSALVALTDTGLAPTFRGGAETDFGTCIVYDFVDGTVPKQTSMQTMAALSRLHAHEAAQNFRRVLSDPSDIQAQGISFLDHDASPRAARLRSNVPEVPNVPAAASCFLHGDPTPANSVITSDGLTFLDWQCPAFGDPIHDLAIALSPAMHVVDGADPLSGTQIDSLLVAYADEAVTDRYRALAPLYHWRMACYCQWKTRLGEAAFAAAGVAEFS
ncbi:phosphotransferase family protein [Pacificibacter marinus]|uniref:phosphotransferase family protein n=1 Tax=Pacificibacter marinus TaxID=658057 RepID=UPI001C075F97|nr:aminoglycoside phosphotransferase family protein [Pacificibacter marinus]